MRRIWLLVVVAAVLFLPVLQPVALAECSEPAALPTTGQLEGILGLCVGFFYHNVPVIGAIFADILRGLSFLMTDNAFPDRASFAGPSQIPGPFPADICEVYGPMILSILCYVIPIIGPICGDFLGTCGTQLLVTIGGMTPGRTTSARIIFDLVR